MVGTCCLGPAPIRWRERLLQTHPLRHPRLFCPPCSLASRSAGQTKLAETGVTALRANYNKQISLPTREHYTIDTHHQVRTVDVCFNQMRMCVYTRGCFCLLCVVVVVVVVLLFCSFVCVLLLWRARACACVCVPVCVLCLCACVRRAALLLARVQNDTCSYLRIKIKLRHAVDQMRFQMQTIYASPVIFIESARR